MALDFPHPAPTARRSVVAAATELALVVGLYLVYRTGRLLTAGSEEPP
jgi:hypothetical protein